MNPIRNRWLPVIAGVVTVLLTGALGVWQLGRAESKSQAAAQLRLRQQEPAWRSEQWPCPSESDAEPRAVLPVHRPVELRGRWVSERTVFLDNRPMGGATGFIVVTPLRLAVAGACAGRVVLVQRGWVPRHAADRQRLPEWADAGDEVVVTGRVAQRVSQSYALGDEARPTPQSGPLVRQNVDDAFWVQWMGQSPLPGAVLQVHAENLGSTGALAPSIPGIKREWPQPDLGVSKHHGYAVQWFAMAAVAAGLTLWFPLLRPWLRARQVDAAAARKRHT